MARVTTSRVDYVLRYDQAIDGGATGAITLRGPRVPSGAVIVDALLVVDTVPSSGGGATLRLDAEASGDVQAQAAISGAPWSTTGAKRVTLTATSAPVRTTQDRAVSVQVGTAALTGGRFRVVLSVVEAV